MWLHCFGTESQSRHLVGDADPGCEEREAEGARQGGTRERGQAGHQVVRVFQRPRPYLGQQVLPQLAQLQLAHKQRLSHDEDHRGCCSLMAPHGSQCSRQTLLRQLVGGYTSVQSPRQPLFSKDGFRHALVLF